MDMEDIDIAEEEDQLPPEPSITPDGVENGGHPFFLIGICALIVGLAIPLVFFFFVKSPQPEEHILFFGFSYYRLLFVLFLTSGTMVYTSLFFLNLKPAAILFFFCLILFCCFPFIIGLKRDLTLSQVILGIPFLANWPIFLNPGYVLIEFLLPVGILIYLFLQVRKIFSRPPHHYTFLCVAVYLSVAAFLGISGLAQARQPTIGSAIVKLIRVESAQTDGDTGFKKMPQDFPYPDQPDLTEAEVVGLSSLSVSAVSDEAVADTPADAPAVDDIEEKFLRLSEKMDGLQSQLDALEKFLLSQQKGTLHGAGAIEEKGGNTPRGDKETIGNIQEEMQRLSARLDLISSTFNKLALLLNIADERPVENRNRSVIEHTSTEDQKDAPQIVP